eukprot:Sro54_g031970.1 n/a (524) ;mRNA; r:93248-94975
MKRNNEGGKPISASGRPGCKGDPRMNRAVAVRLENPEVPLFHALRMGGFNFPANEDSSTLDNDQVTLGQRKNQLLRRLRQLAKKHQNEQMQQQFQQLQQQQSEQQQRQQQQQQQQQQQFQQLQMAQQIQRQAALPAADTPTSPTAVERATHLIYQLQQQGQVPHQQHQVQLQLQPQHPHGPLQATQLAVPAVGQQLPSGQPNFNYLPTAESSGVKRQAPDGGTGPVGDSIASQQGQEKRMALSQQDVEPLRSFTQLNLPSSGQQGHQQSEQGSAAGSSNRQSSSSPNQTIRNQIMLPTQMYPIIQLTDVPILRNMPQGQQQGGTNMACSEEKAHSSHEAPSQPLLGVQLFPAPQPAAQEVPPHHHPGQLHHGFAESAQQQQLQPQNDPAALSNENQAKERMALSLFQSELKTLYCRSMLAAGYTPDDTTNRSPLFRQFAFNAWKQECERLQEILGNDGGGTVSDGNAAGNQANATGNNDPGRSASSSQSGGSISLHRGETSLHHHQHDPSYHPPPGKTDGHPT